ncbi:hypothetical protein [uncultured Amnibacterium sp.]|uniref:hypothetical protein n=1 Tax=uncultured Amnibacterium sp. TaxID=1631851 RepID=UPI0035CB8F46
MSAAAPVTARPASPVDVVALQYANRNRMLGIPLLILGVVVVLSVAISIAVLRAGGTLKGSDSNASILWSVLGYTVAIGVQTTATSFPFALALGSTRRTFVLGALLTSVVQAAVVSAAAVVLLGLELVTGGWFIGARVVSSVLLGGGNPLLLAGVMFLSVLTALAVGGVFGAAWVRFGAAGPAALGLGGVAAVVLAILLLGPRLVELSGAFQPWRLAVAGAVVIGLSIVGQYLLLRRASVR